MNATKQTPLICLVHAAGAAAALCLAFACWKCIAQPLARQAETDRQRIAILETLLDTPAQWQAEHDRLSRRHAELTRAVHTTRQRAGGDPRDDLFIQEAEELARAAGLKLVDWDLGADSKLNGYEESRVEGKFTGSFASTCQFLTSFNQIPRVAKVAGLRINSSQNSDGYSISIVFALYYSAKQHDTEKEGTQR